MKRRDFAKTMAGAMGGLILTRGGVFGAVHTPGLGLSDPANQPMFQVYAPNALDPGFLYAPDRKGRYKIKIGTALHQTGLENPSGVPVSTPVWGYGDWKDRWFTWPGRTFQVKSTSAGGPPETEVFWQYALDAVTQHLLPVDPNLHWCYSLPGYHQYTMANAGVPIITHLHGGNTDFQFDGNPEFFYTNQVVGPQWANVPGGFTEKFRYNNAVPAGNLWYHDHALGITRLNVYAGLAGFYFVRDGEDTGMPDNPLGLPAFPYELAYAIQDRMFLETGELFYPAFPGEPFYDDFIGDIDGGLPADKFPGGGPTALAEFFGDHMVVNGKIWPKEDVEPRNYRMHLLNGTDSRFMVVQFVAVNAGETGFSNASEPLPFDVIGSDQGLGSYAAEGVTKLVFEPGGRYDIVFNFEEFEGKRIIMKNIGGDAPFGGDYGDDLDPDDFFEERRTDRIMAFDVVVPYDNQVEDNYNSNAIGVPSNVGTPTVTRRVALFEGMDEFGRLQPLLGVVNPDDTATAYTWSQPTTENPDLGVVEEWEIYNFTGDAHPIHLHLVHFEILGRSEITFDADEDNPQQVLQHNGEVGTVAAISNISIGAPVNLGPDDGYVENAPKDMVTALPEQVTRIKAHFNKPGRYVWHCHILSHEDHEMMRVLHVGPGA